MATLIISSPSNARDGSAALRTSGRSIVAMVMGARCSTRTVLMRGLPSTGLREWWRSGLHDGDDEADGAQDVADPHAFALGADLHHGLAGVVDLPRDLPALRFAALDRLLQLAHDLLERVAVTVVEDGHPGRGDRALGDVLDVRERCRLLGHWRLGAKLTPLEIALGGAPAMPSRTRRTRGVRRCAPADSR